jgi:hypothetical protein
MASRPAARTQAAATPPISRRAPTTPALPIPLSVVSDVLAALVFDDDDDVELAAATRAVPVAVARTSAVLAAASAASALETEATEATEAAETLETEATEAAEMLDAEARASNPAVMVTFKYMAWMPVALSEAGSPPGVLYVQDAVSDEN